MTQRVQLLPGLTGRISAGEGERILWLHGSTLDSRSWAPLWALLPGRHHVGVNLPWHGGSDPIPPGTDLQELGLRLADYCRREAIQHVVALSFGTVVATQIAIEGPDRLSSVVLASPWVAGGPMDRQIASTYWQLRQLYLQQVPRALIVGHWLSCPAWRGIDQRPGLSDMLRAIVQEHEWAELRRNGMRALLAPAQTDAMLAAIRTDLLVLLGDRELPAFRACAATLEQHVDRCEVAVFPDADHLCLLQHPERSAGVIAAHVRRAATGRSASRP